MPKDETFWNPYRWAEISSQPVQHEPPSYHHQLSGLCGRAWCELEALTPIIIGDGSTPKQRSFIRRKLDNRPFIPATSLKGVFRSIAEIVANAAQPFPRVAIDEEHTLDKASHGSPGTNWELDIVARTFGYLHDRKVFAGLIRFSDALLLDDKASPIGPFNIAVGQPKPSHQSFYPDALRRKLYHHDPEKQSLTPPHAGITQTESVQPLAPGTRFAFTLDFSNLRDEELDLLLYCLALEEEVTITLSPEALGPKAQQPVTFSGPLRHKIGGCKPHGAGSSQVRITRMLLRSDPTARYRGERDPDPLEGEALLQEIRRRTAPFVRRTDTTMRQLRALLIYSPNDPRMGNINYPTYDWFNRDRERPPGSKQPLKPTL